MAAALVVGMTLLQVEWIAHRGASDQAPENTLAAFRLGWQQADACELDIYLTKDGKIAVIHDATTKRTAGVDKPISQQTLDELQALDAGSWKGATYAGEKIPTLKDVLELLPEKKRLFIEIKCGAEVLPELKRTIDAFPAKAGRLAIIGFGRATMVEAKKLLPTIPVFWLASYKADKTSGRHPDLDDLIARCKADGLDGLDLDQAFPLDAAAVAKVHSAGLKLYTWTVNDPETARKQAAAGVDGITTDRPDALRRKLSTEK
ncbi:MAG TPA: glycerophosphodiester phosphodiesterase [Planctomycetota bacterium]|jgi:glycerophosphoryl diester phosphodiesterase|nr:glycerophosphodiester phosphodiesterase [Planctomycetota bacterium]